MICKIVLIVSAYLLVYGQCAHFKEFRDYYHSDPKIDKSYFVLEVFNASISQADFKLGIQTLKYLYTWLGKNVSQNCIVIYNSKIKFYKKLCGGNNIRFLKYLLYDTDFDKPEEVSIITDEFNGEKQTIIRNEEFIIIHHDIVVLLIRLGNYKETDFIIADPFDKKRVKVIEFVVAKELHPKNLKYLGTHYYKDFVNLHDIIKPIYDFHKNLNLTY